METFLGTEGRELIRTLLEDHIRFRGIGDIGQVVVGADGITRAYRQVRSRALITVFGRVEIQRLGYSSPGTDSIFPLDAALNLPTTMYSYGLRKMVAYEIARGSFHDAIESTQRQTGLKIARRQAENIVLESAQDFDAFYSKNTVPEAVPATGKSPLLVITTDGKGIVVRREDLREATRRKAESGSNKKLKKRLSKGEKLNRKRMATVASVYEIGRHVRTADSIIGDLKSEKRDTKREKMPRPRPLNKRVWASLAKSQEAVIGEIFNEALQRDPEKLKEWICLVDGDPKQLRHIRKYIKRYDLKIAIVLDIIHVIEYLWRAARVFYSETDPTAEAWVCVRLLNVLNGKSSDVAAGVRRSATLQKVKQNDRKPVDKCANYLLKNVAYLKYDVCLKRGWPIASGVIEGACRHLIKDRMDVTGARWSLDGAEAVLKMRSLKSSSHFDEYWSFHEKQEFTRNHHIRYKNPDVLAGLIENLRKTNST